MSEACADVERLLRWQQFGGVWRVASRAGSTVTLSLCRCDDGEEVDRLTSDDPELVRWLAGRAASTDLGEYTVSGLVETGEGRASVLLVGTDLNQD